MISLGNISLQFLKLAFICLQFLKLTFISLQLLSLYNPEHTRLNWFLGREKKKICIYTVVGIKNVVQKVLGLFIINNEILLNIRKTNEESILVRDGEVIV